MSMARTSVGEWISDFLAHGRECAYVQRRGYRTERWSYGEVAGLAFQFARELESRGIAKGERVLLWGENCAEWVAAFLGCALSGVIAVPMDDAAAEDFARRVMREVGAQLVVCSRGHAPVECSAPTLILEELRDCLASRPASAREVVLVAPSDPLEIIFTSGTTAEPKGVVITHGNVLSNTAPLETEIQKYLKYERWVHPVRFLNLLPLSHVFGQFLGMFLPPLMAGTVIFQTALGPSEVLQTIRRERVSVLVAVPRMLQSLKEKVETGRGGCRAIECVSRKVQTSGGRKVSAPRVDLPPLAPPIRVEILGLYLRRGRARPRDGGVLEPPRIRGDSGIRTYGDYFAGERESSIQVGEGIDW